jgi:WD40 repeat protein
VSWDPSGSRLATGSVRGDASIWSIPGGVRLHHLHDVGDPVEAVAFSPDGRLVVAATHDGGELIWDAPTGTLQSATNYLRSKVLSVEFDRSSTLVVAAAASGMVAVTDALSGMPVTVLDGPRNIVKVAHFDPSSRRVVGASWDGTARIWDATSPYHKWGSAPVSDDCGLVSSLEPDRRFLAVGCRNRPTRVWDTAHDQLLAELPSVTPAGGDFASAFPAVSAEGDRAAIARGNTVEVYELPGGHLLRTIAHGAPVNTVAFAASGRDIVSGAVDGSLLVTRDNGAALSIPTSGGIDAAGFLPGGRIVATDARLRLRIYTGSGEILADLEMSTRARTLRVSANGHHLVTVPSFMGMAATPELWDVEHYRRVAQLDGQGAQVYSARFVGDDVLTAWGDGAARLWDGTTGQLRQTYRGGPRALVDVTLSSNGSMVVGGDGDGVLRFWDAASTRPLWTIPAHRSYLVGVRVDGNEAITRGFSGDISRWALPDPARVLEACSQHDRCAIVLR